MYRTITSSIDIDPQEICQVALDRYRKLCLCLQFFDDFVDLPFVWAGKQAIVGIQDI
jgi:hypothetical protein